MTEKQKENTTMGLVKRYQVGDVEVTLSPAMAAKFLVNGKNITEVEAVNFVNLCYYNRINPFIGDAFLIKYGDSAQMVVSKQQFMKRADHNPAYDGFRAGLIVLTEKGDIEDREGSFKLPKDEIVGGWCEVYRKNFKFPVVSRVSLSEYNKGQSTWKEKQATMIRKVAVAQAHREAFPNDYNDLYLPEEFGYPEEKIKTVQGERVSDDKREKKYDRELAGGKMIKTAGIQGDSIHATQQIIEHSERAMKEYNYYLKSHGDLQDMTFLTEDEGEELKSLMMKYADIDTVDDDIVDIESDNIDSITTDEDNDTDDDGLPFN